MLRTLIQFNSLSVTFIATFFWIRGAVLLSSKDMAALAGTYFGYNEINLNNLATQKADSLIAGILLAISFTLQTVNYFWPTQMNDSKPDNMALIINIVIFIVVFGSSFLASWLLKKYFVMKAKSFLSLPERLVYRFKQTTLSGGHMKRMLVLLLCLGLAGCVSVPNFNRISLGMNKQEVINNLGNPETISAQGNTEYLKYCSISNAVYTYCFEYGYFVRLVNGKVESYGKVGDFDSTKNPTNDINLNVNNGGK